MSADANLSRRAYAGLFLVTAATLMFEILLTRIFSVTMWYHFAFMAISVAMLGMTAGAIVVYLLPHVFTVERARRHLALSALGMAIACVIGILIHLCVPIMTTRHLLTLPGLFSVVLTYGGLVAPFLCGGVCVCLALTKFPGQVARLYAADLIGAATGCIALVYLLSLTDGPTAVLVVAALATVGALLFALEARSRTLVRSAGIACVLLVLLAAGNTLLVRRQQGVLRPMWVKGKLEYPAKYETWNSFSRVAVRGNPDERIKPFGWGMSPASPNDHRVRQLYLDIDASASTVLTAYDGDPNTLKHLRYDVTNLAHHLRSDARTLVIGAGGGRDILAALAFDQRSVVAVEYNDDIIKAVTGRFGEFTGHLDRDRRVRFVHDEARSYVSRTDETFDIIQVSLIDTWAATAAGAFVLTENALYTVEAWTTFLERLSPNGILTFSRWYFRDRPGELYRLTSLAAASLDRMGVADPTRHMAIVRRLGQGERADWPNGIGTLLVGRSPLSPTDVAQLERVAERMEFKVVLSPDYAEDETFARLASGKDLERFCAAYPMDISPPTDDRPFFFHMLRLRDILNGELHDQGMMSFNVRAVVVLGVLLFVVIGLTIAGILAPLVLARRPEAVGHAWPLMVYFGAIGMGFMLVEISQMQRLILFLGHPTYGLSVVLFSLLLASGIGSALTDRLSMEVGRASAAVFALLLGCLALFGWVTPHVVDALIGTSTIVRILAAVGLLLPIGLLMGAPFPIGMRLAGVRAPELTPWLWGINGATSVCASVVAVVIALSAGISTSFWCGVACYGIACVASLAWGLARRTVQHEARARRQRFGERPEAVPAVARVHGGYSS